MVIRFIRIPLVSAVAALSFGAQSQTTTPSRFQSAFPLRTTPLTLFRPAPLPLPALGTQTFCAIPNRVLVTVTNGIASQTGRACPNPLIATLAVTASDPNKNPLSYRWKSTDGTIVNQNSPTTTWQLPDGPGVHFAYVLVSNGKGGYREGRYLINTDGFGNPLDVPVTSLQFAATANLQGKPGLTATSPNLPSRLVNPVTGTIPGSAAPTAPAPPQAAYVFPPAIGPAISLNGVSVQPFSAPPNNNPLTYAISGYVYPPNSPVYLADGNGHRYPAMGAVTSDERGQWVIRLPMPLPSNMVLANGSPINGGPTPANWLVGYCGIPTANWKAQPAFKLCNTPQFGVVQYPGQAIPNYYLTSNYATSALSAGYVKALLADGTPCGINDDFFGVSSTGTYKITHASGLVEGPFSIGSPPIAFYGGSTGYQSNEQISWNCENAPPVNGLSGVTQVIGPAAPVIASIQGTVNGTPQGIFKAPKPNGTKSDNLPGSEVFLAAKGLDTPLSACRYYMAIGVASGCDSQGNLTGAITFDQWKRSVALGEYTRPNFPPTVQAVFVNHADLNLTRFHSSISLGRGLVAAVVCNALPPNSSNQPDVDAAIKAVMAGQNLVACVAMDYMQNGVGVNNNQPFTRFMIFGPNGQLLPSINLDNRREKYVPGACVACHGGDFYTGKFPEDGSGQPNIGSHFLPYDTGNFSFSSATGLREPDQEEAIYNLNMNVLNAGPTNSIASLVAGWYKNGHVLDKTYLPASWGGPAKLPLTPMGDFYVNVVARSCRGCHVALPDAFSFETGPPIGNWTLTSPPDVFDAACYGAPQPSGQMPNSQVTYDGFFASDQPTRMTNYLQTIVPNETSCASPPPGANPGN